MYVFVINASSYRVQIDFLRTTSTINNLSMSLSPAFAKVSGSPTIVAKYLLAILSKSMSLLN